MARSLSSLLLLGTLATAPLARADGLDEFVKAQMARRHVPGIAYAVVQDRAPLRTGAFGIANLEWETPVTPDTVFAIGSLSQPMAAAAVMLLVQDGALRLDARVDALLDGLPSAWGGVTVRQLLTNTAGIKGYTELPDFERRRALPVTPEGLVASVAKEPLLFSPGTRFAHGNTGWYLLGMIVEKLSGMRYAEFLERRVTRPAGLTATRMDAADAIVPRRAAGYEWKEEAWRRPRWEDPTWPFAGGGVLSTVRDVARFASVLRDVGLLSRGSLEAMWSEVSLAGGGRFPYGFGWHVESYRGRRAVWHTGHMDGFSSALLLFPSEGLAVVVLANGPATSPLRIARGIASFVDPAFPFAERIGTRPDADVARVDRIRRALREAADGALQATALTPGFATALTPAQRAAAGRFLKGLRGLKLVTCDRATDGLDVYGAKVTQICTYRYDIGETTLDVDHWLTADGRIAWIDVDTD